MPDPTLFDRHEVTTVAAPTGLSSDELQVWVGSIGERSRGEVVRVKGVVESTDAGLVLVQVVGRRREVTPVPEPERCPPTDLVVISLPAS